MNVLLIEDDIEICEVIENYFISKGADITIVNDGRKALKTVAKGLDEYSVVLLDIMLPGADGYEICRSIRKSSDIPLIFITAKGREDDVLSGYSLGCDDYIVKPFMLSALYAKCQAILKRTGNTEGLIVCGDICVDTKKLVCTVAGREVDLPPKSFAILRYLIEHKDWVVDRDTLLEKIWSEDAFCVDRVIDNHIKKLRKALGSAGSQIHTVIGRGYKLSDR
jgi:DNA-binding response OmpR family regulator